MPPRPARLGLGDVELDPARHAPDDAVLLARRRRRSSGCRRPRRSRGSPRGERRRRLLAGGAAQRRRRAAHEAVEVAQQALARRGCPRRAWSPPRPPRPRPRPWHPRASCAGRGRARTASLSPCACAAPRLAARTCARGLLVVDVLELEEGAVAGGEHAGRDRLAAAVGADQLDVGRGQLVLVGRKGPLAWMRTGPSNEAALSSTSASSLRSALRMPEKAGRGCSARPPARRRRRRRRAANAASRAAGASERGARGAG